MEITDNALSGAAAAITSRRVLLRTALAGAAVTIGGAVVPLAGLVPVGAQEGEEEALDDAGLAAFVASLELAVAEAYGVAIASGKLTPAVATSANGFMGHHREHATALASVAGPKHTGKPNAKLLKNLSDALSKARDEKGVVRVMLDAENASSATYLYVVGLLKGADAMRLAASILPVESAHAVTLAQAFGLQPEDERFVPPFETQQAALTPDLYPLA